MQKFGWVLMLLMGAWRARRAVKRETIPDDRGKRLVLSAPMTWLARGGFQLPVLARTQSRAKYSPPVENGKGLLDGASHFGGW